MFESETYEERCWKAEAENARLREELATLQEALDLSLYNDPTIRQLQEKLAAAQATIEQMLETDLKIVGRNLTEEMALAAARLFDKANGRRFGAETLWQVLFDAAPSLAIPTNQDALHEMLARECERLAEFSAFEDEVSQFWLLGEAAAHRARKEKK